MSNEIDSVTRLSLAYSRLNTARRDLDVAFVDLTASRTRYLNAQRSLLEAEKNLDVVFNSVPVPSDGMQDSPGPTNRNGNETVRSGHSKPQV